MRRRMARRPAGIAGGIAIAAGVLAAAAARGNGGPFIVKHPSGDPAAKGILARLDPTLTPGREERLEVVEEDLSIAFGVDPFLPPGRDGSPPFAHVRAAYRIRNPLEEPVEIDFGFPILRGIYLDLMSMRPRPQAVVTVDGKPIEARILSTSVIYGIIRARAREVIDRRLAADPALARDARARLGWNERDAALLAQYAALDLRAPALPSRDHVPLYFLRDEDLRAAATANLGILAAIGEQKATQFLAHLAGLLDDRAGAEYERIFAAWGGEVRETSVDLVTGKIRPREIASGPPPNEGAVPLATDAPTVYARVDYLDERADLTDGQRASLLTILKNLPVIFTFAPMNILHYRVRFAPKAESTVVVSYSQFAYLDTRAPASFQLAYVIHPASLWKSFGPIRLAIEAPEAATIAASVPLAKGDAVEREARGRRFTCRRYDAVIEDKTGELLVGISSEGWGAFLDGFGDISRR
ncbi:MAG: hypothetical protein JXP34_05745 [Planctomycetes bacterium]|nr:hypothetical protein [Planctomycetota bacterium]